jgi:hypothetical protein
MGLINAVGINQKKRGKNGVRLKDQGRIRIREKFFPYGVFFFPCLPAILYPCPCLIIYINKILIIEVDLGKIAFCHLCSLLSCRDYSKIHKKSNPVILESGQQHSLFFIAHFSRIDREKPGFSGLRSGGLRPPRSGPSLRLCRASRPLQSLAPKWAFTPQAA